MAFTSGFNALTTELCAALGVVPERVSRVVIDIDVEEPVRVYVEMFGTTELVEVLPTLLKGAEIRVLDKQPAADPVPA